jgi:hypothetical protein
MATFKAQIEDLTGSVGDDGALTQWLTDGAKELINIFPPELKMECSTTTSLTSSTPMDLDASGKVLYVTRENADSGYYAPCRQIPSAYGGLTTDSSNMMYYATATDPAYWSESDTGGDPKLFVKPDPTANQPARVFHIAFPSVANTDSAIVNFPDEAEYLVVLYASIKGLHRLMNDKNSDLPTDISELVLSNTTLSLPTFSAPSVIILPVTPSAPTMSEKSVSITGTAPTYTKPIFALESKPSISNLSISSVAPVAPTVDLNTISFSATAPTYTPPVVSPDFSDASSNWLTTEEDSEMVASRMQIISGQLQEYQSNIQSAVNTFNKENVVYQASLQTAIQDGQLAESEEGRKLQKYSNDLQTYQADVNKEVQEYRQNFEKELQLWQQNNSQGLQKYSQDIQNELNEFNKENVQYQALLQKDLRDAQLKESKEGRDLQKYGSELSSYQAEVGAKVQEFQTTLQKNLETFKADITKYTSEVGKISADNQSKIGKFGQDLANYGAKIQKHNASYKWYQGQYTQLKQDYNQGIQMLISDGMPRQQKGEG